MTLRHTLLALALTAPLALVARADVAQDTPRPNPAPSDQSLIKDMPARTQPAANAASPRSALPLQENPTEVTTARLVYGLLSDSRFAYRPRPMDAAMSQDIFKRYLDSLDGNKMFFTAQDIADFSPYRQQVGDALQSGELAPAYRIFAVLKQRVNERAQYARGLLTQNIFDFSGNDRWYYDREKADWATGAQLDDLWKQSVRNDWLRLKLAGQQPDQIRKTLDKRYAGLADNLSDLNGEDVFQSFMTAYTNSVDPHTDYFDPRSADRFNQQMSLSLEGIGAQLQKQDDIVVIREIIPGGPADLSHKFKSGDRIVGVGQGNSGAMEDVIGWRIDDVVAKIKGPKGTQVRLSVIPAEAGLDSKPKLIELTRAKIKLEEQAAKSDVIDVPASGDMPARRIGVVKLPAFYQDFDGRRKNKGDYTSATRDVARMLDTFKQQKLDGVVIDLRNNGGGSLNEAVDLTGLFIDQGPVVQVRETSGRVSVEGDDKPGVAWDGPLAVLINRGSASASEIFAGAIKDYGRGLIIGENTFGKGTVQNMVDLDRWPANEGQQFGQVKLTIAQFFLPGGSSTQEKGVAPDIAYPVTVDASEFGESTYDNALPWSRIAAVPHTQYGNFASLLPKLQQLHATRAANDKEFQWFEQDVSEFRADKAKGYISLNEAERRSERDSDEAKVKQRQAERKAMGMPLDPLADDSTDDGLTANERNVAQDVAREKAAEKAPDPLLHESAAILSDATTLLQRDRVLSAQVLPVSKTPGHWAD